MVSFFRRFLNIVLPALLTTACTTIILGQVPGQQRQVQIQGQGQTDQPKAAAPKASPTPAPAKASAKPTTADQIAELVVFFYGGGGARERLNQIRKTTLERGSSVFTTAEGKTDKAKYSRFIIRADSLDKERVRLDQEFPSATYSLILNDEKVFGIYNNTVFTPREDAVKAFENQIVHGLEALLRFKENGSTLELQPKEKLLGVDYYVVDVTDKQGRKTRFYISAKTYRVLMLTYEDEGVKYRRRFYDYNYAQGTLVPFRTVLWANDKQIEETDVGTVTFGQKVDEELFKAG